ncbi:hypothetical protein [Flavobacterium ginsenosidimutans]|uniref:hypothetical protein n=1 Tax=Flavobacterium ginsenosidimutans TaxID=687844 RepID=UPI000DAE4510|nr:hypothetical protein [Flavobacterium ginsenosidimutans]KAF2328099.1 hypothetical protein DM444_20100 [Flavobacterium ginsenosidimutans]
MENKRTTAQENYNAFLDALMQEHLFLAAKDVHQRVVTKFNVSKDNARKIVSRAATRRIINSSKPSTFGNGQYIYYCNTYMLDLTAVKKITEKARPPIYRLIVLLELNNGIVSYYEALKITASPSEDNSSKISSLDDILKLLSRLDFIYEKRDGDSNRYIIQKEFGQILDKPHESRKITLHNQKMMTDCSLMPDILSWLINANIIDNTSFLYRSKTSPGMGIIHNYLYWDACAYTKTTGINEILGAKADSKEKQTLVVLDVVLAMEYTFVHLNAFMARIQININSVKEEKRKTLPVIIYRECSRDVFFTMRKNGIMAFNVNAIFGSKICEILKKTSQLPILLKSNQDLDQSVESILETIKSSGQEGALRDLRGTLFEYLMFGYLSSLYPHAGIEQNVILKKGDGKHEFDYIITSSHPPELVFVELKGLRDGTFVSLGDSKTKATLKWFFNKSMGLAKDFYKDKNPKNLKIKAVFITTGGFWKNTKEFREQMENSSFKSAKSKVIIDRSELLALLNESGFNNEVKTIEKYYSEIEEEYAESSDFNQNEDEEPDDLPF